MVAHHGPIGPSSHADVLGAGRLVGGISGGSVTFGHWAPFEQIPIFSNFLVRILFVIRIQAKFIQRACQIGQPSSIFSLRSGRRFATRLSDLL